MSETGRENLTKSKNFAGNKKNLEIREGKEKSNERPVSGRLKKSKDIEKEQDKPNKEDVITIDLMIPSEPMAPKEEEPNWFVKSDKGPRLNYEEAIKEYKLPTKFAPNHSYIRDRKKVKGKAANILDHEKPQLSIPPTLPKMLLLRSEAEMLDRNAVSILNMIHMLEAEIMELDKDIKKEQAVIDSTAGQLLVTQQKRTDIIKRMKDTQDWLDGANENMKNFQSSYFTLYNEFGKMKTNTLPEIAPR